MKSKIRRSRSNQTNTRPGPEINEAPHSSAKKAPLMGLMPGRPAVRAGRRRPISTYAFAVPATGT